MSQKNNFAAYVDIMLNQFNSGVIDLYLKRLSGGQAVSMLAFHRCGPGSIPGVATLLSSVKVRVSMPGI